MIGIHLALETGMLDLFVYKDYRHYLRDWLQISKGKRGFSLRRFAARAGLGSPAYLKMVIDGQRNLGEAALQGFLHGLRLMGEERLYFLNLVLWNQSKSQEERARFEGRLNLLRKFRSAKPQAVSLIQKRIEGVRAEIESLLALEFTPEEAIFLAKQFMPESWATSVIVRPPVKKVGSQ